MESARPAHPCRLLFRCIPWARVSMSNTPSSTHLDKVRKRSQVRWSNNGTGLYSTSCQGNIHPAQIHPKKHRAPTANLLIFGGTAPCQTQRKRFPLPLEPLQKHYSLWDNGVTRASVFNPKKKTYLGLFLPSMAALFSLGLTLTILWKLLPGNYLYYSNMSLVSSMCKLHKGGPTAS